MSNDMKKGFNTTLGIVLALCFIFIVLPIGTCAGCMVLGTAASGASAAADKAETQALPGGNAIEISNMAWKVLDENQFLHEVTYKFDVTNQTKRTRRVSFDVLFVDADGLTIDKDLVLGKSLAAGETMTFSDKSMMDPGKSGQLVNMVVQTR